MFFQIFFPFDSILIIVIVIVMVTCTEWDWRYLQGEEVGLAGEPRLGTKLSLFHLISYRAYISMYVLYSLVAEEVFFS